MRFTIERIRTLVLATGVLLVVAITAFLAVGKWKNPFNRRDIPKRLGIDIEQEANGVTYTQAHAGHTLFKIHASKVVQLKNSHAMLHDVQIELYGTDGSRVDRIVGDEFEYDQKGGTAIAAGPVEITLMRPGVKPAIATVPLLGQAGGKNSHASSKAAMASPKAATASSGSVSTNDSAASVNSGTAAEAARKGQIDVKTSGLVFNEQTGVATTKQRVDFSSVQGSGSSMGATYDSQNGFLVLDHAVELTTRATAAGGPSSKPVEVHAEHAEFERDSSVCRLHEATAKTETEQLTATDAKLLFREDGSIAQLDASGGFTVATVSGGHVAAPTGTMKFDEKNHPRSGHAEGGVTLDSTSGDSMSGGRISHGSSSMVDLEFTDTGDLRHAHMQQAVEVRSKENAQSMLNGKPVSTEVNRTWRSAVADVEFRKGEKGRLEPATIHGTGGVTITSESRRANEAPVPSKLQADEAAGEFGPGSALTSMTGTGHARMEETASNGALDTATGDRVEAHFSTSPQFGMAGSNTQAQRTANSAPGAAEQVQSAVLDGHVVLIQQPVGQLAGQTTGGGAGGQISGRAGAQPQQPLRATAGRAVYESAGEWLHLTMNPRVDDGGLQLTADKVDVSQASGDAFGHGNVKATWTNNSTSGASGASAGQSDLTLGGKGPAHAIAGEVELHQASGEATFRGHARLWQEANSVAGPVIVLDREKQTLTAKSADAAEPVRVVMVSAGAPGMTGAATTAPAANAGGKAVISSSAPSSGPSVIRVRGGDLWYSGIERRALIKGGALGPVAVETGNVESTSTEAELFLTPAGNGGNNGGQSQPSGAQSQVDRMTASGHVVLNSQGRHGTGEQLSYTSGTGDYVLTGTASALPRMSDPSRGTVTGETLIFHSRDDSVSVEGGGQKTMTETTAPDRR